SATKSRARVKPARTVRVSLPPSPDNGQFIITVSEGDDFDDYIVTPIASDYGTAFTVQKLFCPHGNSYHVNLCGKASSCECTGHLRWGPRRHVEALPVRQRAGKI